MPHDEQANVASDKTQAGADGKVVEDLGEGDPRDDEEV